MSAVLRTIAEARQWVAECRAPGSPRSTVGLVPTMGALHEGHASLFRRASQVCDHVAASIFVNPLQFGAGEDFDRYPRTWDADLATVEREGIEAVFAPGIHEMYSEHSAITVDPGPVGDVLCGASRPGHFRGVLTVVAKLFHILQPDKAFFGQKDAQQAVLIRRMVADLNFPVAVEICPIVRERDGLAISSRNRYLGAEDRVNATVLFRALHCAESMLQGGVSEAGRLEQEMARMIRETPGAVLDYARVVDSWTMEPAGAVNREVLAAVAVRFGTTRLIDNLMIGPKK